MVDMTSTSRALIPLLPLLAACRVGPAGNDTDTDTGNASATTGDEVDTDSTDTDTPTDTPLEDTYCGLNPDGPDEPWFEVWEHGMPLEPDGTIYLECGAQGSFMFELEAELGNVIPPDGSHVPFHAELDVAGGFNIGPNGHFAVGDFDLFVGCCDDLEYDYYCYYETTRLRLFPPDAIADMASLHEQTGTLTVTMTGPDGPVEQAIDVQLWAVDEGDWEWCNYAYPFHDPLPLGPAIPE